MSGCCGENLLSTPLRVASFASGCRSGEQRRDSSEWSDWVEVTAAVPIVPTGVRFSSGQAVWNAVSGATSYDVISWPYRSEGTIRTGVACCQFTLPTDADSFGVRAVNSAGTSDWSRSVQVPAQPPGQVSNVRYSSGQARWNAVSGATSYDVAVSNGDTEDISRVGCCGENLLFTSAAVRFRVRAVNSAGTSDWSDWVEFVTEPAVPSGVRFSSGQAAWNSVSEATSYDVRVCTNEGCSTHHEIDCCEWRFGDGSFNSIRVRAVNSAGTSDWSTRVDGPLVEVPAVPSGVRLGSGAKWNAVSGATSYDVAVSNGDTEDISRVGCCGENLLFTSAAVRFRVRAVNSAGTSDWSDWVEFVTEPAVPSGVRFSSGQAAWNSVSEATSYDVRVCTNEGCSTHHEIDCCEWRFGDGSFNSIRVRAVNSAGTSDWSTRVDGPLVEVPAVPSGVRLGSGAKWNAVSGATSYDVAVSNGDTEDISRVGCCGENLLFTSAAVRFRVRAVNSAGTSDWSDWVSAGASERPTSVRVPAKKPGLVSYVWHTVGWAYWNSVPRAATYDLRWTPVSRTDSILESDLRCCKFDLPNNAARFSMRAVNSAGSGVWSPWIPVSRVPTSPRNVSVAPHGTNQFRVTWSPPASSGSSSVSEYEIVYWRDAITNHPRYTDQKAWETTVRVVGTSHISSERRPGIPYKISVIAVNSDGLRSTPATTTFTRRAVVSVDAIPTPSEAAKKEIVDFILDAYIDAAPAACPSGIINWTHVAAIGYKESSHGRFSNLINRRLITREVNPDDMSIIDSKTGLASPIFGVPLNGGPGLAKLEFGVEVEEKYRGKYGVPYSEDYMRAVGPFQFRPDEWELRVRDLPGKDPHNFSHSVQGATAKLCTQVEWRLDASCNTLKTNRYTLPGLKRSLAKERSDLARNRPQFLPRVEQMVDQVEQYLTELCDGRGREWSTTSRTDDAKYYVGLVLGIFLYNQSVEYVKDVLEFSDRYSGG